MPRAYHSEEAILAAVRDLLVECGPRGLTIAAISARSGAPVGSLYHRFGSVPEMVARLRVATVRELQADLEAAAGAADPGLARALAVVEAIVDFAARRPRDTLFLLGASRRELEDAELPAELAAALRALDERADELARRLARELYGRAGPGAVERVEIGVFGVAYASLRRVLAAGGEPGRLREVLRDATGAVLDAG